ncbi:MAG: cytidine deaminase [Chloroflexota bacterium]
MEHETLLTASRAAAKHASAPYSNFPVGAALVTTSGAMFSGCNIESPAYPQTLCAERVAIFAAVAAGERPVCLAVSCVKGDPADPNSLTPCGACRQVMMDQMGPRGTILVDGVGEFTVAELLPYGFRLPGSR